MMVVDMYGDAHHHSLLVAKVFGADAVLLQQFGLVFGRRRVAQKVVVYALFFADVKGFVYKR